MADFKINAKKCLFNTSVTKILQNPYNPDELIATYFSGEVHIWKLPSLESYRKLSLPLTKLTSIVPFQNSELRGFLLGVRNGELMMLNENFELISSMKPHKQSITEIVVSNEYIITIGMDGKVLFFEKDTLEERRRLELECPLFSAVEFGNQLFLSSMKSYIINMENYEWTENKRFNRFFIVQNQIYGTSDERGLSCVNSNSNNYIPAEYMLLYQRKIVIFSQKSICVASQIDKLQYKAKKYAELSAGESITTGFTCGENIYVGGNEGNIYWISLSEPRFEGKTPNN